MIYLNVVLDIQIITNKFSIFLWTLHQNIFISIEILWIEYTYQTTQTIKIVCQKWDLNPRPHTRTRILIHISSLSESKVHNYLESGALDNSAILTLVMREEIYSSLLC